MTLSRLPPFAACHDIQFASCQRRKSEAIAVTHVKHPNLSFFVILQLRGLAARIPGEIYAAFRTNDVPESSLRQQLMCENLFISEKHFHSHSHVASLNSCASLYAISLMKNVSGRKVAANIWRRPAVERHHNNRELTSTIKICIRLLTWDKRGALLLWWWNLPITDSSSGMRERREEKIKDLLVVNLNFKLIWMQNTTNSYLVH